MHFQSRAVRATGLFGKTLWPIEKGVIKDITDEIVTKINWNNEGLNDQNGDKLTEPNLVFKGIRARRNTDLNDERYKM